MPSWTTVTPSKMSKTLKGITEIEPIATEKDDPTTGAQIVIRIIVQPGDEAQQISKTNNK